MGKRVRWILALVMMCVVGGMAWCRGPAIIVIDDFEAPKLSGWGASGSPDYYKDGRAAKGLAIMSDTGNESRVMRAHVVFMDAKKSEVVWITKSVTRFPAMNKCRTLSFRYKITTNRLDAARGFICRIRFSESSFVDRVFAKAADVVPNQWHTAVIALDKQEKPRNIYNSMFAKPTCLTFRLDDDNATPIEFDFCVDDIRLELKEAVDQPYTPRPRPRERRPLRRALLITHSTASYYFVREALEAIEPEVEIQRRFFRGLHFPVFGFPKTSDELFAFDCVVLVDVDPYVLTREQVEWLCDYVASGGGLLFVAGPNTLGRAKDFKRPLADLLPVTFGEGKQMATVNAAARTAASHPITSGLPTAFDRITKAHSLKLKPDTQCLVEARKDILSSWGMYSGGTPDDGRIFAARIAHSGRRSAALEAVKFYVDPKTGKPAYVGLALVQGDSDGYTGNRAYVAKPNTTYRLSFWLKGDIPSVNVGVTGWKSDTAAKKDRQTIGTSLGAIKPSLDWQRFEGTFVTKADTRRFAIRFNVFGKPGNFPLGSKVFVDDVWLGEDGTEKNMAANPGAEDVAGAPVLVAGDFGRGRVAVLNGYPEVSGITTNCFFTGKGYRELVSRTVRWLAGESLLPFAGSLGHGYVPVKPPAGPYPPLDRSTFFPIMSVVGTGRRTHLLDERGLRERVDDLIEHGFNTAAIVGLRHLIRKPWSNQARLLDYAARYAQSRGMAITFEYASMTNIPHHGRAPKPCVLAPDYHDAIAARLRRRIETAKDYPRLIGIKILDEPGAGDWVLDRCEHCQAAFRKRFGTPLRKLSEIPSDDIAGRWQVNQFIADYVAAGYMTSRQVVREARAPFDLLLTYGPNFGVIRCSERYMVDPLGWSRAPDLIDFDDYPYFYPVSQNIRMLKSHWCHALQRAVAQHLDKPAGFYFELDDRNYPVQINPVEASAECAFTAVGQGCHYLNSFINRAFGTGVSSRPERWAHTGRELKKIRAVGPLLLKTRKAPSQLAVYFPHTQWYSSGKPVAQLYAYQLLMRAFGECDITHEQILREAGLGPVRALALLQVEIVPDDVAEMIVNFVKQGGVLLCDEAPSKNERGEACRLPAEMFKGESQWAIGECRASRCSYGKGTVWTFSQNLDDFFRDAVEKPVPEVRRGLLKAVRNLLDSEGLRTHVRASDPEVEVDLLLGTKQAIVVVINHRPDAASASVTVRDLGFKPGAVLELPGETPVRHRIEDDGVDFDVRLPARCGALVGIR